MRFIYTVYKFFSGKKFYVVFCPVSFYILKGFDIIWPLFRLFIISGHNGVIRAIALGAQARRIDAPLNQRGHDALRALLENAKAMGCRSAAAGNLGHLAMARELGFAVRGDYGLNVFNSRSLGELADWGLESAAVSFELRHEQVRDLIKPLPCEAIVYGRLPLMIMENCIIANGLGCKPKNLRGTCRTVHTLTDRKGESFPVLSVFGCRNEIENAKTLFLADKPEYTRCGLTYGRLRFTTEDAETCVAVLKRYLGMSDFVPQDYTRGLFYRGVE